MTEKVIPIVYEGRRKRLSVDGKSFLEIEEAIKELCGLTDIAILAKQKDGSECELWDDEDLVKIPSTTEIFVYENFEDPLAMKIGSELFSLSEIPASNTILIKVAKEVVMNDFNVPDFVSRLVDFVDLVRKAGNHLIAASEGHLANDLKVMGRATLKPLLNKCKTSLDMYVMSSRDILEKLLAVFEYCRDGDHDSATINLKHLEKVAISMKEESETRAKDLEKAIQVAGELLSKTEYKQANEGDSEGVKKEVLDSSYAELTEIEKQKREEVKAIMTEAMAKEDYDQVDQTIGVGRRFFWSILYAFNAEPRRDNELYTEWIKEWKDKEEATRKAKGADAKLCTASKQEETQRQTVRILEKDYDKTSALLNCLNQAVGSMRMAFATMQRMGVFWETMAMATNQFAQSQTFIACFQNATKDGGKTKQLRVMGSRAFKRQGISYLARVVAVRDISSKCRRGMSTVDEDMDLFLTDTPSRAEAERRLAEWRAESRPVVPRMSEGTDDGFDVSRETEQEIRKCFQLSFSTSVEESGE